jgi:hypothetical protein
MARGSRGHRRDPADLASRRDQKDAAGKTAKLRCNDPDLVPVPGFGWISQRKLTNLHVRIIMSTPMPLLMATFEHLTGEPAPVIPVRGAKRRASHERPRPHGRRRRSTLIGV